VQMLNQFAEVLLGFRVRVEVLDVDDESLGGLFLRLPRFNHPAHFFGHGD